MLGQIYTNGSTIKTNGSIKKPLPQLKHSIDEINKPIKIPIAKSLYTTNKRNSHPHLNNKLKIIDKPQVLKIKTIYNNIPPFKLIYFFQYLNDSHSTSLQFDNSQQQLLNSTIDSSKINLDSSLHDNHDDHCVDDTAELNGVGGISGGGSSSSSYNQRPLNNWNYRRPIIGPNG